MQRYYIKREASWTTVSAVVRNVMFLLLVPVHESYSADNMKDWVWNCLPHDIRRSIVLNDVAYIVNTRISLSGVFALIMIVTLQSAYWQETYDLMASSRNTIRKGLVSIIEPWILAAVRKESKTVQKWATKWCVLCHTSSWQRI